MIPKPEPRARVKARRKRLKARHRSEVMQAVDLRDGMKCRVCRRSTTVYDLPLNPHHHHIIFRSRGGVDSLQNIVLLCALCHDRVHRSGMLRLSGNADHLIIERCIEGVWSNDETRADAHDA